MGTKLVCQEQPGDQGVEGRESSGRGDQRGQSAEARRPLGALDSRVLGSAITDRVLSRPWPDLTKASGRLFRLDDRGQG